MTITNKQIASKILKLARFAAGCRVPNTMVMEIVGRELGIAISQDAYFAALDILGTKIIRVRGSGSTIMAA